MVRYGVIVVLFFLTLFLSGKERTGTRQPAQGGGYDLTVKIDNIRKVAGIMEVGLYDKAEHFPKEGKQFLWIKKKVTGPVFTYTFSDLPPGDYAMAVYQDIDSDGKIDKNLIGVPTEPYGFSNNIKPRLSAPSFEKTRFRLASDTTVCITLFH